MWSFDRLRREGNYGRIADPELSSSAADVVVDASALVPLAGFPACSRSLSLLEGNPGRPGMTLVPVGYCQRQSPIPAPAWGPVNGQAWEDSLLCRSRYGDAVGYQSSVSTNSGAYR